MSTTAEIKRGISAYFETGEEGDAALVVESGLDALPALREYLLEDRPIDETERLESLLKRVLGGVMKGRVSPGAARRVAEFQQQLGFILKYKSYAIKAASPLGYSIFLQQPREGFSFQRHLTHKTEVFHILEVAPGGFVFLCSSEDWEQHYEQETFERWLGGEPHPFFDRRRFAPSPGDVFVISELGVVHTVVGCVLEEFATVSTDMVDRLHDQNAGRPTPSEFTRSYAEARLAAIPTPTRHRLLSPRVEPPEITAIAPVPVRGGERWVLTDSFVTATHTVLHPGAEGPLESPAGKAVCARVFEGEGQVLIAAGPDRETGTGQPVPVSAGDLLMFPPGVYHGFRNGRDRAFRYSEHGIAPEVAFY